jgi:hypothetical protein
VCGDFGRWGLGKNLLLLRVLAVGGHVFHEGSGTSIVEEVDADTGLSTTVAGEQGSVEVGQEVDILALELTLGEDTRDGVLGGGVLGVVTNDHSVDEESQQSVLVGGGVVFEQRSGWWFVRWMERY